MMACLENIFSFFRAQGVESMTSLTQQVYHGIEPQQSLGKEQVKHLKRGQIDDFEKCKMLTSKNSKHRHNQPSCNEEVFNDDHLSTYGFLIDRSSQKGRLLCSNQNPSVWFIILPMKKEKCWILIIPQYA